MLVKIIYNFLLILAVALIQIAFISSLPLGLNNLNIIIVVIIFILSLIGFDYAIVWAMGLGFILDTFSFSFFGLHLVALGLTTIIANMLLNNYFTNRSLYSLLSLVGFSTISYQVCLNLFYYFTNLFARWHLNFAGRDFLLGVLIQLALNLVAAGLLFYALHYISKRLRPAFLLKYREIK